MKINQKDLMAGLFLILIAGVGLWLNMDHTMGTARRMGPGYMPWMVFWLQVGLGSAVLLISMFSGPELLTKWSSLEIGTFVGGIVVGMVVWWVMRKTPGFFGQTYNGVGIGMLAGFLVLAWAPGWRVMGMICAALCVFGLLLEKVGFIAALTGTIIVSCLADPQHIKKPLGILGCTVFLLIMCWFVFIKQLDIRVNLWPQF